MKTKIKSFSLCVFLMAIMLLNGCSLKYTEISQELQKSFQDQVGIINDMNRSLTISIPQPAQKVFGSDIEFNIQNKSQDQIFLPNDFGNKLFIVSNGNWLQIKNSIRYHGDGFPLFPSFSREGLSECPADVSPLFDPSMLMQGHKILRIFVEGKLMKDGKLTDVPVGAYVDVNISP